MRKTLLIITALMLVVGFTSGQEPIDGSTLVSKDSLQYAPGSDKPYSGEAVWYYEDGQKWTEGTYKDGKLHGLLTVWYENGQKQREGNSKDGELDGKWTVWYENGQKMSEEYFRDGKPYGLLTGWYENGQKSTEGIWNEFGPHGLRTSWYPNGQKSGKTLYEDGVKISQECWDESGDECECIVPGDCN